MTLRELLATPRDKPIVGCSMLSGQPQDNIHTNSKNGLIMSYLYTSVHTNKYVYVYVIIIIKEKEAISLGKK